MKNLIAFLAIMLLLLTPSCKWLREKGIFGKKKADTMAVWLARQNNIRIADSIRKAQDRLMELENARLDSIRQADELNSMYRYNIIVGSFITPEYARLCQADFASRGYNTKLIRLEGTQFEMVSAEAHDKFRPAVERLRLFQDTVAYDAWLYIAK